MTELKPTDEQLAIVEAARLSPDSLMIQAYAGAAKTTTLTLAAKEIKIPGLALAFNRSIKETLEKRFPANFSVQTMNGLGFASLRRALPATSFKLDDKKVGKIIKEVAKDWKEKLEGDQWDCIKSLVTQAQLAGIVPGGSERQLASPDFESWIPLLDSLLLPQEEWEWFHSFAEEVLRRNNQLCEQGIISFDDQIYYSVCVAGRFPQFPLLMVDEAQDLNALQHRELELSVRPTGRLIVCGDPLQAIYQFRGAESDSMGKIERLRSKWLRLPLTMTFRCPTRVVERQWGHAPGFRAKPGAQEGHFMALPKPCDAPDDAARWTMADLFGMAPPATDIAILCRNNAPLLSLAFSCLRRRIPARMLGRDIGQGLASLSKRLFPSSDTSLEEMTQRITDWQEKEETLALASGKEEKVNSIRDRAECLRAVLSYPSVRNAGDLRRELESLFAREDGRVTLSSIHKAKGLEWDMVMLLDPWRIPSRIARERARLGDDRQLREEMNLRYVAETRTKHTLVWASLADFA